ncbi:hypothetical protein RHMOL_Rhmol10G0074900 [Rhododendron molle]|uniref:Uncharacterized protein n=1 Tax=Rhododendron molle TaxID=49168 RepID=A0ACC0M127_RHOML|nr:hypothetical protein RHMOL_Rhmol10G0074900 [Rhododendron molle]
MLTPFFVTAASISTSTATSTSNWTSTATSTSNISTSNWTSTAMSTSNSNSNATSTSNSTSTARPTNLLGIIKSIGLFSSFSCAIEVVASAKSLAVTSEVMRRTTARKRPREAIVLEPISFFS